MDKQHRCRKQADKTVRPFFMKGVSLHGQVPFAGVHGRDAAARRAWRLRRLQPEWANDLGLEKLTWTALRTRSVRRSKPARPIPFFLATLEANREAKNRVVAELIDGRLTLFREAAAAFPPRWNLSGVRARLRISRRLRSEERLCQQVIAWVPSHEIPRAGFSARLKGGTALAQGTAWDRALARRSGPEGLTGCERSHGASSRRYGLSTKTRKSQEQ